MVKRERERERERSKNLFTASVCKDEAPAYHLLEAGKEISTQDDEVSDFFFDLLSVHPKLLS